MASATTGTYRFLDRALKLGIQFLTLPQFHKEDHALVRAALRLLPHREVVHECWSVLGAGEGIEDVVYLGGAKSNASGIPIGSARERERRNGQSWVS